MSVTVITPGQRYEVTEGVPFSQAVAYTGDAPTSWDAALSGWFTIDAVTGIISGTLPVGSAFDIDAGGNVGASYSGGDSNEHVELDVILPSFEVNDISDVHAAGGELIDFTATMAGPREWTVYWTATGLPSGVTKNFDAGRFRGVPTAAGTSTVTVTAAYIFSGYPELTDSVTFTIYAGAPVIDSATILSGYFGVAFSQLTPLEDEDHRPVASWSATGLPGWAAINATTGRITGTPSARGDTTVSVTAIGAGGTDTGDVTISIGYGVPIITTGQAFTGKLGVAFSHSVALTDAANRAASSWSATGLPGGLSINSGTGVISGTPSVSGSFTVAVTATGAAGSHTKNVAITINHLIPVITTGQTFTGDLGIAFSESVALTDATDRPGSTWSATGLPSGLSIISGTGVITGTPVASGTFTSSITVTGSHSANTKTVSITIQLGAPLIEADQTLAGFFEGAFSRLVQLVDAANRTASAWSATGLPSWAAINATTGRITGTPDARGDTTVSVTATGPGGSDTADVTISIGYGVPIITSGQTFSGTCGVAFTQSLTLTDATNRPATSWSATGLPGGLSINPGTGVISGTPSVSGAFTPTIRATGAPGSDNETVSISLAVGSPWLAGGRIIVGLVTVPFSGAPQIFNAAHRPVTSWSATGLPGWASMSSSTGAITGTPDADAETVISVTVTGPGGSDTEDVTLSIGARATVVGSSDIITGEGLGFWEAMAHARAGTAVILPEWVELKLALVFVRGLGRVRAVAMMVDESTLPATMRLVTNADLGPAEYASTSWAVKK